MNLRISFELLFAIVALTASACSNGNSNASETIPCTGIADCKSIQLAPVCGDTLTTNCDMNIYNANGTLGACVYHVPYNSKTCACVAQTVQYCRSSGGSGTGGGPSSIQDCIATGGSATSWGGCHN